MATPAMEGAASYVEVSTQTMEGAGTGLEALGQCSRRSEPDHGARRRAAVHRLLDRVGITAHASPAFRLVVASRYPGVAGHRDSRGVVSDNRRAAAPGALCSLLRHAGRSGLGGALGSARVAGAGQFPLLDGLATLGRRAGVLPGHHRRMAHADGAKARSFVSATLAYRCLLSCLAAFVCPTRLDFPRKSRVAWRGRRHGCSW